MVVRPMMSYAAFVWWQKSYQTTASAAQYTFRMLDSFKPNTGDMQGHLKIYEDFREVMDQYALSDKMPIRYDFEVPLEVKIYRDGTTFLPNRVYLLIIQMALGKMG
jgi:hypothetical protein